MKQSTILTATALSLASIFLSGCATTQDGRLTQAEATGGGALLGGLLGSAFGSTGRLVGVAVGAAAGYAAGTSIASKKAKFASAELFLDHAIVETDKLKVAAQTYNNQLDANVTALESRAKSLAKGSSADKTKCLADIKKEQKSADDQLKRLNAQILDVGNCADPSVPAKNAALTQKKEALEAEKNRLIRDQQTLAAAATRMAI